MKSAMLFKYATENPNANHNDEDSRSRLVSDARPCSAVPEPESVVKEADLEAPDADLEDTPQKRELDAAKERIERFKYSGV